MVTCWDTTLCWTCPRTHTHGYIHTYIHTYISSITHQLPLTYISIFLGSGIYSTIDQWIGKPKKEKKNNCHRKQPIVYRGTIHIVSYKYHFYIQYTYIFAYIHIYTYTYIHTYIHTFIHMLLHTRRLLSLLLCFFFVRVTAIRCEVTVNGWAE